MGEHAIELINTQFVREHFKLGPINLAIPKGYVTAIVGPNGSGKSTLFSLLMNLIKPTEGSITVLDQTLGLENDDELKQRIGYLNESNTVFDSGIKGSTKAAFHARWYKKWDEAYFHRLIYTLDVRDDKKLRKMSKGTRQKFDFSLALAHHPQLLLLDEPSSGLDPIAWKQMIEIIHRYMEDENNTVLMATHIIDEVKRLADYIVFIVDGQYLGIYEKDELLQSWVSIFIETGSSPAIFKEMPGYQNFNEVSSGFYEVISSSRYEAEAWLQKQSFKVHNTKLLELDEILYQYMNKVRSIVNKKGWEKGESISN